MNIFTDVPTNNAGGLKQKCQAIWVRQIEKLKAQFKEAIEEVRTPWDAPTDMPVIFVKKETLLDVLEFLKTDPECEYTFLVDLTATDEGGDPRFEMVYH